MMQQGRIKPDDGETLTDIGVSRWDDASEPTPLIDIDNKLSFFCAPVSDAIDGPRGKQV